MEGPTPAAMHMAVTRGAIAVITPILLHTELRAQDTINVARMIFLSLLPVTRTIFSPIKSVMPAWNRDDPITIIPAKRTIVVLL